MVKSSKKKLSIVIDISTRRFIDHSYRIAAMKWTDNAAGRSAVPDSRGSESTSPGAVSAYSRFFLSERVSSTSKRSGDDHASRLTFRIRTPYTNSDRDKSVLCFLPFPFRLLFFFFFATDSLTIHRHLGTAAGKRIDQDRYRSRYIITSWQRWPW